MEKRSKCLGKQPLPGERQGMSGAGAGHDSGRTTGGNRLSRRTVTGKPETATAEPNSNISQHTPAEDVLQENVPATTKAGLPRQRIAWSDEMNQHVMRCYFIATKLETIASRFRPQLHKLFLEKYPHMTQITEQRLIDQKRVIIANNRLPPNEIQNIKEEVSRILNTQTNEEHTASTTLSPTPSQPTEPPPKTQSNSLTSVSPIPPLSPTTSSPSIPGSPTSSLAPSVPTPLLTSSPRTLIPCTHQNTEHTIKEELIKQINCWRNINPKERPGLPLLHYRKQAFKIIKHINDIIPTVTSNNCIHTIEELHTIVYSAAYTTLMFNNQNPVQTRNNKPRIPQWQIRIQNRIETLRQDIGRLTQYRNGNRSNKLLKKIQTHIKNNTDTLAILIDTLKQKLAVYSTRLRRYKEAYERKQQNNMFWKSERKFYNTIKSTEKISIKPPSKEEVKTFWSNIWNKPVTHNNTATWIQAEQKQYTHIDTTQDITITTTELRETVKKTHNWKTPGVDGIHNYWYKQFTSIHEPLAQTINYIIHHPEKTPKFLTEGITYIKPKNQNTENPANYRPITCLPTLYKIITSLIAQKIDAHLHTHNILTDEQKGCKKNSQGCKEQLIIDSIIMKQAEKQQRNLYTCYIDYKKAFDSVPHSWLEQVLDIYRVPSPITQFLKHTIKSWRTTVHLNTENIHTNIHTDEIKIQNGIFQGDSLSALWFCLCLNPLSKSLNRTTYGFHIKNSRRTQHTINHLLYMDDIKLYGSTLTQIKYLIKTTEDISKDIGMEFGTEKCRILKIEKGKWAQNEKIETMNNEFIEAMEEHETYKYLGFQQNTRLDHKQIRTEIIQKYKQRVSSILQTKLNSKNIIKAINTFAIPLLTYSFGIIKWTATDTEDINRINRVMLTKHRMHHPKSCIERITLPRQQGGRGLIDITELHEKQIKNLQSYFHNKHDSQLHKAVVKADEQYTPLDLSQPLTHDSEENSTHTQQKLMHWSQKSLHSRHYHTIHQSHISKELSYAWLTQGQLYPETEGFTIAIQDQVVGTKNYRKYIMKDPNMQTDKCRKCQQYPETIEHITNGCKLLAGTDYTERHNTAAKILHQEIALKHNLVTEKHPYYKYQPELLLENEEAKIYWDTTLHTDRTIAHNRPDITYTLKKDKITYLIDIAIPSDTNIKRKEEEKIEKYTALAIEIKDLWKQHQVKIIPVILSPTGITPLSFIQNINKININTSIHAHIQRAVILKTCNTVRKFLNPPT